MPHAATYAFWLSPPDGGGPISELIHSFAQMLSGPRFPPHLTLLSGLRLPESTLVEQTARLAALLQPIPFVTQGIGLGPPPFRALFLPVLASSGLHQARGLALEASDRQAAQAAFLPHLSLFYGELPPARVPALVQMITQRIGWGLDETAGVVADQLQLVAAFGPPSQWRILRSIPLTSE